MANAHSLFEKLNPYCHHRPKDKNDKYYEYIPANFGTYLLQKYIDLFTKIKRRKPKTFIDLGCGKGGILYDALSLGLKPTGVEYSKDLVTIAEQIKQMNIVPKSNSIEIIHADLFDWVPEKQYDIVYFYRPMSDRATLMQFFARVEDLFPLNQFIIAHGGSDGFFKSLSKDYVVENAYLNAKDRHLLKLGQSINDMQVVGKYEGQYLLRTYNHSKRSKPKMYITTAKPFYNEATRRFEVTYKPINAEVWG